MKYKVLAALYDELNQGWVWVTNSGLESRAVVKITNKKNNKAVYCECLEIEDNYMSKYNNLPREHINKKEATIIINAWYRGRLGGLKTQTNHELEIRAANGWWGKLRACCQHPQVVVRIATRLAILSIILAVISIFLSLK
jgi:hypothetical protein